MVGDGSGEYPISTSALKPFLSQPKPIILQGDALADWASDDEAQLERYESGLVSMMVVPLLWQDRPIAVLALRSRTLNVYTDVHADLMQRIADHIAGAIANAQVHQQTVELAEQLEKAAYTDDVTGLFNRPGFEARLADALARPEFTAIAVISISIERVREIEDRFGFEFANKLWREFGSRLSERLPEQSISGRSADDGFVVALFGKRLAMAWAETASDLKAELERPFEIDGEQIGLDITLGASLYPGHDNKPEELTRKAVLACRNPGVQSDTITLFKPAMDDAASDHVRVLTAVRQGLAQSELELFYQPKVDLTTRKIVSAEALVRWNSPDQGIVSPGVFIPVLEASGYMWEFTGWTLNEGMEQLHLWTSEGAAEGWAPVQVAINVSANDFQDPRFPERIASNLELWGVDAKLVEIEVTETAVMDSPDRAIDVCRQLKGMGITVAIDDFGVGQSPLAYLDRLDIDIIKIDRAFVMNIHEKAVSRSIVESIVGLAKQLDIQVVAEGIELEEEHSVLADVGCDFGQGYLYSRPVPAKEFRQLLADNFAKE